MCRQYSYTVFFITRAGCIHPLERATYFLNRAYWDHPDTIIECNYLHLLPALVTKQLAEKVGTCLSSIARLENGSGIPSLSFLERIARALDARIELHVIPR